MEKRILAILTALALGCNLFAQVTVDVSMDTLLIRIGEQTKIHLTVSLDSKSQYVLPEYPDTIVAGVECLEASEPIIDQINDGQRMLVSRDYLVTSFDSGHYYLPPMEVLVENQPYQSQNLSLKVETVEVDLEHPEQFFPPKDVLNPPFAWEDWELLFWLSIALLPMLGLCIYFISRLMDNKPIIKHIRLTPKLPPHQKAMKAIESIKAEKQWAEEDSKEYYTQLTNALRVYIKERYHFNATEMTSAEIIENLQGASDVESMSELNDLFQTADLVKFAKYSTLMNENDMNLVNAIEFINATKVDVDPATLNKQPEMTVEEKRSKQERIGLIIGVCLLAAGSTAAIVGIGFELYRLCF